MNLRSLFLFLALGLTAAFTALNWTTIIAPSELSFGITSVQLPLGLAMLGFLALLTAAFLVFLIYMQTSALLDTRRHSRELHANRELADQAEASRFTELRTYLEAELAKQEAGSGASSAALLERIDQLDLELRSAIEQSGNTLAAYIGELEDRFSRTGTQGSDG